MELVLLSFFLIIHLSGFSPQVEAETPEEGGRVHKTPNKHIYKVKFQYTYIYKEIAQVCVSSK